MNYLIFVFAIIFSSLSLIQTESLINRNLNDSFISSNRTLINKPISSTNWNNGNITELFTLKGHIWNVNALVVLPNGNLVSCANDDELIKIWDIQTKQELFNLTGHTSYVFSLVVLPNQYLASSSLDNTIIVWDLTKRIKSFQLTLNSPAYSLALLPNGNLVSGSDDGTISVWDIENKIELYQLKGHIDRVSALIVFQNRDLISGSWDGTIRIWNIQQKKESFQLTNPVFQPVFSLALLPNGKLASGYQLITIWDLVKKRKLFDLAGHPHYVESFAILPNGDLVSGGSFDSFIKIWDIKNQYLSFELQTTQESGVLSLAFLQNGNLTSGGVDGTINIYG